MKGKHFHERYFQCFPDNPGNVFDLYEVKSYLSKMYKQDCTSRVTGHIVTLMVIIMLWVDKMTSSESRGCGSKFLRLRVQSL